jgi:mRNA-degrading endonuclease RelE of RelBE toxin-antitoxin system
MNKLEKLLRKISKHDRDELLCVIEQLMTSNHRSLDILKLKDSDMYRVRSGRYRILFHYEHKEVVVDSIRLRNKKTYK